MQPSIDCPLTLGFVRSSRNSYLIENLITVQVGSMIFEEEDDDCGCDEECNCEDCEDEY